jgi:hypothetical protein
MQKHAAARVQDPEGAPEPAATSSSMLGAASQRARSVEGSARAARRRPELVPSAGAASPGARVRPPLRREHARACARVTAGRRRGASAHRLRRGVAGLNGWCRLRISNSSPRAHALSQPAPRPQAAAVYVQRPETGFCCVQTLICTSNAPAHLAHRRCTLAAATWGPMWPACAPAGAEPHPRRARAAYLAAGVGPAGTGHGLRKTRAR